MRDAPRGPLGASFCTAAVKWVITSATGSTASAVAVGMRSWAKRMRTRYRSALSVLPDYERSRGG